MTLIGLRRATEYQLVNGHRPNHPNDYNPQRVRRSLLGGRRWSYAVESSTNTTNSSVIVCPKIRESFADTRSSCSAAIIFDSPTLFPNSLCPPAGPDLDRITNLMPPPSSGPQIMTQSSETTERRIHVIDYATTSTNNLHIDTCSTKPRCKTIRSFNARLNSFAQKGNYQEILSLIEDVQNGTISLSGPLNTYSFTILLKAYCNAANLSAARKLLDTMHQFDEQKRPNRFTYNTLLNAFIRWEDMRGATELFEFMETSPNEDLRPDHVTYTTLMKGYAASGDMEGASRLFQRLRHHPDPDCRPNQVTYNTMLKGFVAEADMESADQLLEQMFHNLECHPDIVSMNTIIGGYARQGNLIRARYHLDRMRLHRISPNAVTFHAMIEGSIRHGDIDYADKLFHVAINDDNLTLSPATYRVMIEAWLRVGDLQKAKFVFTHQAASNDETNRSQGSSVLMSAEYSQTGLIDWAAPIFPRNSKRNRYSISSTYQPVNVHFDPNEPQQCSLLRFPIKRESVGSIAGDDYALKLICDQF